MVVADVLVPYGCKASSNNCHSATQMIWHHIHSTLQPLTHCGLVTSYGITELGQHWSLIWHHNGHDGVSNHQPHDCLLNRLFRHRSKKTSKLRVTGLCAGKSLVTSEFPAQMASYAENISIWWCHYVHVMTCCLTAPCHYLNQCWLNINAIFGIDLNAMSQIMLHLNLKITHWTLQQTNELN